MKKKIILLWVAFVVCVIATVILRLAMDKVELQYEEVTATVTSTSTEQIVNKKTGSRTTLYKVKVRYDNETYDLENVHSLVGYSEGRSVTAYLANGKLYANVEGVKTSTPIATAYFIFLFASFGMLFVAPTYTAKLRKKAKEEVVEAKEKTETEDSLKVEE